MTAWLDVSAKSKRCARATYERLDVETLGWHDRGDVFLGQGAQDGGLSGVVETEDKDTGLALLFLEHTEFAEKSHFYGSNQEKTTN